MDADNSGFITKGGEQKQCTLFSKLNHFVVKEKKQEKYKLPVKIKMKTLPKALRTQALTALTSNFVLVGLVHYAW